MKIIIFTVFLTLTYSIGFSQKLYKDKTTTLNEITSNGYVYKVDSKNSDVYIYKQYDTYGEALVKLTFEGSYLRKCTYFHLDPKQTLNRLRDVYAKTSDSEADTFNPPSNGSGSGIASNTKYYQGRARFECVNNYSSSNYAFTVIILD